MRVLHVVPTYLPAVRYGGTIFSVHALCRGLAARGHDVHVFTTNMDGCENSDVPLETPVDIEGVKVTYFAAKYLRRLSFVPSFTSVLVDKLKHFDLMHLHSVFLWLEWQAAAVAKKNAIPYIVTPHGMLVKELISRKNRLLKHIVLRAVGRSMIEGASAIQVTSKIELKELEQFGYDLAHIAVIPNGVVDVGITGQPTPGIVEAAANQPYVLYFGRLSWKKRIDLLLHAIAMVPNVRVIIAGTDDEGIVPRLTKVARDLGIEDRVVRIQRTVLGADKEYLYSHAHLFVLPSYSENFGNTVLEAMQWGVPVVVTPEVGAADVVIESGGGIVADGNPTSISKAISYLLENPVIAAEIGSGARELVKKLYTWEHISGKVESLYEQVLDRKKAPQ